MRRTRLAQQKQLWLLIFVAVFFTVAPRAAFADVDKIAIEGTTVTVNAEESFDLTNVTEILWDHFPGDDHSLRLSAPASPVCTFVTPIVTENKVFHLRLWVTYKDGTKNNDMWNITVQDNGITGFPSNFLTFYTYNGHAMGIRVDPFGNEDGLVYLKAVDPATITETKNRPATLPYGLIETRVRMDKPGRATVLNFYLERPAYSWLKWSKYMNGSWIFGPDYANIDPNRLNCTIVVKDGGDGDDDGVADGMIYDPCGLGSPPGIQSSRSDDGGTGCFIRALRGLGW